MTPMFPLLVNILVIGVIAAELIATVLGAINANQLLVVSAISGGLTIFSMKLSQQALDRLKNNDESGDARLQKDIQEFAQRRMDRAEKLNGPGT